MDFRKGRDRIVEQARERLAQISDRPEMSLVRKHPALAVGLAFGVGVLTAISPRSRKLIFHVARQFL